ncbi:two component transcriptional regulator, winged helix family [Alkalispirochaeta americana]|uniref:Two component transcriptional regulator, winged helix family n=1 Tax=Alkalispirochaeta americana TaxID=159291 RepID=A0A1N6U693_9SPIO|nr:response regulator [Alkalispirochaeta americana]SIQ61123.1 two component transcriptional regulator, winged helix family [Alkalispirochaeta americana]
MGYVLIVEDEPDILELVRYNLEKEGFIVRGVSSGEAALNQVRKDPPDLVVLDLMLPGVNGWEVCRELKQDTLYRSIPVVMLTARTEDSDVVAGLEVGADDYVTKPFNPKVLMARLRAALRRTEPPGEHSHKEERILIHGITIDITRHQVTCRPDPDQGEPETIPLSATEFSILEFLSRNPGWVFSRSRIIDAIRGEDYPVTERSVDVQILGLRRKLGICGQLIETVRGVEYRLKGAD